MDTSEFCLRSHLQAWPMQKLINKILSRKTFKILAMLKNCTQRLSQIIFFSLSQFCCFTIFFYSSLENMHKSKTQYKQYFGTKGRIGYSAMRHLNGIFDFTASYRSGILFSQISVLINIIAINQRHVHCRCTGIFNQRQIQFTEESNV